MPGRLFYRFLAIIPVTLTVFLLSVWMFYSMPAVKTMDTSAVELGGERDVESLVRSLQHGNDPGTGAGIFYFSLLRGDLPADYLSLPAFFQTPFKKLSGEVRDREIMRTYARWIVATLEENPDAEVSRGEYRHFVELVMSSSVKEFTARASENKLKTPLVLAEKMAQVQFQMRYPAFRWVWNGRRNLFHYYLTGILGKKEQLTTRTGENISKKVIQSMHWTLAYTLPVIPVVWLSMYGFVLKYYDRNKWLELWDRVLMWIYSFPTFVIATLVLIFLASHRYGWLSALFPFPVFAMPGVDGIGAIYQNHFRTLLLPMLIFSLAPTILFYRIFLEKIISVTRNQAVPHYLRHLGMSDRVYRFRYLGKHLFVASLSFFSGILVSVLTGSLIIEYIFNIPGIGRFFYESLMEYDIASSLYLIFVFTLIQQTGNILSDFLIDYFLSSRSDRIHLG